MITIFGALLVVTILGAGIYPSLFLSAYKPIEVISGKMSKRSGGAAVRKFFIVTQFTIAVALIICGTIINSQLYYFRNTDTGMNRTNVLMVPFETSIGRHYQAFRKEVQSLHAVENVATAHYPIYKGYDMFFALVGDQQVALPILSVDKQFFPLMKMQWKISPSKPAEQFDDKEAVINEAAITKLNLNGDPVGQTFSLSGSTIKVGGVLKDFNFESLQKKIDAVCVFVSKDTGIGWGSVNGCLFAKIKPHVNLPSTIENIKQLYEKYEKQVPFRYSFMNDAFNSQYVDEERLSWLFNIFTILTVLIACMGLFGLAAFAMEQRMKEIGIRKVLGAGIGRIINLLSKDFIKLILIAIVIATPVAWYSMNKWLQDFAYRININWWVFAIAGLSAIVIAIITISYQAIKAAIANPVKSLRTE
jgi:putative ABC transport system permease protein